MWPTNFYSVKDFESRVIPGQRQNRAVLRQQVRLHRLLRHRLRQRIRVSQPLRHQLSKQQRHVVVIS